MDDEPLDTQEMIESSDDFADVYRTHSPAIYRFLLWRTKDSMLSEDLTGDVFMRAWRARRRFHGGSVQAWLYRIARNALTDHWRRPAAVTLEHVEDRAETTVADLDEKLDNARMFEQLQAALDKLPRDMREVLVMRFLQGKSCRQVAQSLHISESNARVLQYRALKKLRSHIS